MSAAEYPVPWDGPSLEELGEHAHNVWAARCARCGQQSDLAGSYDGPCTLDTIPARLRETQERLGRLPAVSASLADAAWTADASVRAVHLLCEAVRVLSEELRVFRGEGQPRRREGVEL